VATSDKNPEHKMSSEKKGENTVTEEIVVSSREDLFIEVDRPAEGVLKVPELGVEITPGPAESEPLSDIMDLLTRIEGVLTSYVGESKRKKELLQKISQIKSGKKTITVVIEKPQE